MTLSHQIANPNGLFTRSAADVPSTLIMYIVRATCAAGMRLMAVRKLCQMPLLLVNKLSKEPCGIVNIILVLKITP